MTRHLPYGGSSEHRTIGCNGWLKKSENLPQSPPGDAAVEGSMHHEVMERCFRDGLVPQQCVGLIYKEDGYDITREYTEDDVDLTEIAYRARNNLLDDLDIYEIEIEPFVEYVPGSQGGSIDLLGLSRDRKTLIIEDLKFGSVAVEPDESPNLGLYGISARKDPKTADMFTDVEKILFVIIQPRVKGVTFTWACDLAWLDAFEKKHKAAVKGTALVPGSWCKYCPAEPFCETKRTMVMASNLLGARDQKELNAAARIVNEVEDWVKSIKEEMYLQMVRGVPVQGWKIVNKKNQRSWLDEKKAAAALTKAKVTKKAQTVTKFLSPAQMEKVVKKNKVDIDLDKFILSESSGTTIATEDDSREAVIVSDIQGELKEMMK
jgi:hypothetical protein